MNPVSSYMTATVICNGFGRNWKHILVWRTPHWFSWWLPVAVSINSSCPHSWYPLTDGAGVQALATARSRDLHLQNIALHPLLPGRLVDSLDGRPAAQLSSINEAVMIEVNCIATAESKVCGQACHSYFAAKAFLMNRPWSEPTIVHKAQVTLGGGYGEK